MDENRENVVFFSARALIKERNEYGVPTRTTWTQESRAVDLFENLPQLTQKFLENEVIKQVIKDLAQKDNIKREVFVNILSNFFRKQYRIGFDEKDQDQARAEKESQNMS